MLPAANWIGADVNRGFEDLVMDEERHFDQYDTEQDNLEKFGEKYLALQSIERSKNLSMGSGGE